MSISSWLCSSWRFSAALA